MQPSETRGASTSKSGAAAHTHLSRRRTQGDTADAVGASCSWVARSMAAVVSSPAMVSNRATRVTKDCVEWDKGTKRRKGCSHMHRQLGRATRPSLMSALKCTVALPSSSTRSQQIDPNTVHDVPPPVVSGLDSGRLQRQRHWRQRGPPQTASTASWHCQVWTDGSAAHAADGRTHRRLTHLRWWPAGLTAAQPESESRMTGANTQRDRQKCE